MDYKCIVCFISLKANVLKELDQWLRVLACGGLNENYTHCIIYWIFRSKVVQLFGKGQQMWPCWARYITGDWLWHFQSRHHSRSFLFSLVCVLRCDFSTTAPTSWLPSCYRTSHHNGQRVYSLEWVWATDV